MKPDPDLSAAGLRSIMQRDVERKIKKLKKARRRAGRSPGHEGSKVPKPARVELSRKRNTQAKKSRRANR